MLAGLSSWACGGAAALGQVGVAAVLPRAMVAELKHSSAAVPGFVRYRAACKLLPVAETW